MALVLVVSSHASGGKFCDEEVDSRGGAAADPVECVVHCRSVMADIDLGDWGGAEGFEHEPLETYGGLGVEGELGFGGGFFLARAREEVDGGAWADSSESQGSEDPDAIECVWIVSGGVEYCGGDADIGDDAFELGHASVDGLLVARFEAVACVWEP